MKKIILLGLILVGCKSKIPAEVLKVNAKAFAMNPEGDHCFGDMRVHQGKIYCLPK